MTLNVIHGKKEKRKKKRRKKKGMVEAQITQKTNPSSEGMSGPKCHPQAPQLLGLQ